MLFLNLRNGDFKIGGRQIVLTTQQKNLLTMFWGDPRRPVSYKDIIETLWTPFNEPVRPEATIQVLVSQINAKINPCRIKPNYDGYLWFSMQKGRN